MFGVKRKCCTTLFIHKQINSINTESYFNKSKQASGFSFFFFRPLTHPLKTCCLCGNPIWWLHYQEIGVTIATWCTSVHDIITDTIVPIYASGKTIQILLLFLFLPVPVPASDFKPALHKMPSAKWQLKRRERDFAIINDTENNNNTENANVVYWIYTRTKQKWDLGKQEIRSSHCKAEHEQSNLGHTESKNPPWDTFPTFFPNDFGQLDLDI